MSGSARFSLLTLGAVACVTVVATAGAASETASRLRWPAPVPTWTTEISDDADHVEAILPAGGKIYLGGGFTEVGPSAGPLLTLRARDGRRFSTFPQISGGEVNAVEPDGRGGVFVAGDFTHVGAVDCRYLAHIRASGSVDAHWCPRPNRSVAVLAYAHGRLYFAGNFTRVRGARRLGLAAVTARTGRPTAWRPGRPDDYVTGLAAGGTTVFAVGEFRSIGGRAVHNIAALDRRTGKLRPWRARLDRSGCSTREPCLTPVGAVAVRGHAVYIAGYFNRVRGAKRNCLAALDSRTGRVLPWQPDSDRCNREARYYWRIAPGRRAIYVVGLYGKIGGRHRERGIAALDPRTGAALLWHPRLPADSLAKDVAPAGPNVVISYEAPETDTDAVIAVDARTGQAVRWKRPPFEGFLGDLTVSGSRLLTPSTVSVLPRHRRYHLASYDPRTRRMTAWAPRVKGQVLALAASRTTLYVGGCFSRVNGRPRHSLAAFDLRTGKLLPWNPGANECVWHLALYGKTVYLAGQEITSVDDAPRSGLAAVDASTGALRSWDPHPVDTTPDAVKAEVDSLAASGGTLYVGGRFTSIGGANRRSLAALDAVTGLATPWNPNVDGNVFAVEPGPGTVFVAGDFEHVGLTTRPAVAAIDSSTGSATAFDARAEAVNGDGGPPVLRRLGHLLFLGGEGFEGRFAHESVLGMAILDASTGRLLDGPPDLLSNALAFAQAGHRLYVGGNLSFAGRNGFVVYPF